MAGIYSAQMQKAAILMCLQEKDKPPSIGESCVGARSLYAYGKEEPMDMNKLLPRSSDMQERIDAMMAGGIALRQKTSPLQMTRDSAVSWKKDSQPHTKTIVNEAVIRGSNTIAPQL